MRPTWLSLPLLAVLGCGPELQPSTQVPEGCDPNIGKFVASEGAQHVAEGTPVTYQNNPPSSGNHSSPLPYGKYRSEQRRENWIHTLEHGGIALLYNCPAGCDDIRDKLEAIQESTPADETGKVRVLTTPDSRMPRRVAAVAWTWVLELDTADEAQIRCFIQAHKGKAPENL